MMEFLGLTRKAQEQEEGFQRVYQSSSYEEEGGTQSAEGGEGSDAESSFSRGASGQEADDGVVGAPRQGSSTIGKGKSTIARESADWPFHRNQFLQPKMLKLDLEKFTDKDTGLQYLLKEMDKQAQEEPIVSPNDTVHDQQHLHGWRYGPAKVSTLAEWKEKQREYVGNSEQEILEKHFGDYLQTMFSKKSLRSRSNLLSGLESTIMETLRVENRYYVIVTGHLKETKQQGLVIYKYSQEELYLIHEVRLGCQQPLVAYPYCANTWVQNGRFIYYFKIRNQVQEERVVYTLCKYDLIQQTYTELKQFQTAMKVVVSHVSGERNPDSAAAVLFSHYNLSTVEKNENEYKQIDEEEFLNSQFICLVSEYYAEAQGERLRYQIRSLKDFKMLMEEHSEQRLHGVKTIFLQLSKGEYGNFVTQQDLFVVSLEGMASIYCFKEEEDGLEDYSLDQSPEHQYMLDRISEMLVHIATTQYFYYENVHDAKEQKEYLHRNYHQMSVQHHTMTDIEQSTLKDSRLAQLYENAVNVAIQRQQIASLIKTFLKSDKDLDSLSCINANLIYDEKEDHYTVILKRDDGDIHIVTGRRDERRFVASMKNQEVCVYVEDVGFQHPFETAQRARSLPRIGLKQLDRNFANVFIQQYQEDEDGTWFRSIVFIDETGLAVCQNSSEHFNLALARVKGYALYAKLNKIDCWSCKRLELAEDDRRVRPRINCQFGEGLFIELHDHQTNRVYMRQKAQILFDSSQYQIEFNESLFQSQQLTQCSNVYKGRKEGEYCQDYQWCFIGKSKLMSRIQEYRVTYNRIYPEKSKLQLIGFKLMVFRNVYPRLTNHLAPLFNDKYEIDGTQWNLHDFSIQLPRFKEGDYQFHSDLASGGYKKYYLKGNLDRVHSLLFEVRLSQRIQENAAIFSPVERLSILEQQIRTLMNMVPHDMHTWRTHLDNVNTSTREFFQPLETLRGQSVADFFVVDPDVIKKKIKLLGKAEYKKSIIDEYLDQLTPINKKALKNELQLRDFRRQDYEYCKDFFGHDVLLKCFDGDAVQVTSSRILIEHFLTLNKSVSAQRMMMAVIPYVLESDEDYDEVADFFIALKGGNTEMENKSMSYAQHLKIYELPQFSDEEFHMEPFTLGNLNRTDLSTFITDNILTRFQEKDHLKLQIPVEHFSVEFLSQRLHFKMQRFWSGGELVPYEVTEYDLANTLSQIVNKYDYKIEKYTSVRFMVDCQFETTYKFFRFQCILYICGFFIPLMTQIFLLSDSPWLVRLCNMSCLATSCFFLGLEYIQLQDVGWAEYAGDFYNIVDMAMFVTYVAYFVLRMADPASALLPLSQRGETLGTEALVYLYTMAILNSCIVIQSFLKIMFFLRIREGFGLLVDLVAECLVDAIPFTVFLLMWIALFAVLFRLQGLEVANDDYELLDKMAIYGIQTYRNSIGDIAAPAYGFWAAQTDHPKIRGMMIFVIWATWFLNQFFLTIILLNFLIAILSESFNTVMQCATQHKYKQRVAMNMETFLILKSFRMLKPFEGFTLTANCSAGRQEADPIADAIDGVVESQTELKGQLTEVLGKLDRLQRDKDSGDKGSRSINSIISVKQSPPSQLTSSQPEPTRASVTNKTTTSGNSNPAEETESPNKRARVRAKRASAVQDLNATPAISAEAIAAVRAEVAEVKVDLRQDIKSVQNEMQELKGLMQQVLQTIPSQTFTHTSREEPKTPSQSPPVEPEETKEHEDTKQIVKDQDHILLRDAQKLATVQDAQEDSETRSAKSRSFAVQQPDSPKGANIILNLKGAYKDVENE